MKNKMIKLITTIIPMFMIAFITGITIVIGGNIIEKKEANIESTDNVDAAAIDSCWYLNGSVIIGYNPACGYLSNTSTVTLPTHVNGVKITHMDVSVTSAIGTSYKCHLTTGPQGRYTEYKGIFNVSVGYTISTGAGLCTWQIPYPVCSDNGGENNCVAAGTYTNVTTSIFDGLTQFIPK